MIALLRFMEEDITQLSGSVGQIPQATLQYIDSDHCIDILSTTELQHEQSTYVHALRNQLLLSRQASLRVSGIS